jgi:Tol biopolymer transport system component
VIAYTEVHEETKEDLWVVPADTSGDPVPLLVTPFREGVPLISPDGERIAYLSDESGIVEVYVASYPDLSGKTAVSNGGGREPRWSSDGTELFFRVEDRMMAVRMGSDPRGGPSRPVELFRGRFRSDTAFHYPQYDVAADGRFLMIQESESTAEDSSFGVVFNWFEELKRLVPTGRQ